MTVMLAVSMLLIAGSAVALGFGWITANESLVWASIVATGAAAILLAITYYLSIRAAGAPVDGGPPASDPPASDPPPPETQEFEAVAEDAAGEGARPDDDRGGADVKVLLVDDDRSIRNLLHIALSLEEGIGEVREATDGSDALRVLDEFKPDVILLDYWMPRMDGARAAPLIRAKHPDVRIVAFSGVLEERPIWADAYYTKGSLPDLGEILLGA